MKDHSILVSILGLSHLGKRPSGARLASSGCHRRGGIRQWVWISDAQNLGHLRTQLVMNVCECSKSIVNRPGEEHDPKHWLRRFRVMFKFKRVPLLEGHTFDLWAQLYIVVPASWGLRDGPQNIRILVTRTAKREH